MGNFLQIIYDSLTSTPGVLIYNLLLAFSFASALQGSLVHWRGPQRIQANRQATGLFVLLIFQLALFAATSLGWTGAANLSQVLPVIDRVLVSFSLVWIIWLWAFPEPVHSIDVLAFMLSIVCVIAGLFSLGFWSSPESTIPFNGSWLDQSWFISALVLVLVGSAVLLIKHPDRWGTGLFIMAAMGIGLLLQLLLPPVNGDYAPSVRLAQAVTFPLLIILPQRLSLPAAQAGPAKENKLDQEKRRSTTDPKTLNSFLELAMENDPLRLRMLILRVLSQAILADLSLLVTPPTNDGKMNIEAGYDLIREEILPPSDLPPNSLPLLANALIKGRGVRLPYNHSISPDMKTLGETLGLANPGNLLAVPLGIRGQNPLGGLLLLSPYSSREWTSDDQAYLTGVAEAMAGLLQRASQAADLQGTYAQEHLEIQTLRQQMVALRQQTPPPPSQDITALVAFQKEIQGELAHLQAENETLRKAVTDHPENLEDSQLENELRLSLRELAHLQNSLANANIRIMELEKLPASAQPTQKVDETLADQIQELRQAAISLHNQVNQISAGDKEIQYRQIEKIKVSVERLRGMVGDLFQATHPAPTTAGISLKQTDPGLVLELVRASLDNLLRDKGVHLHSDIPDHCPLMTIDTLSFRKILQNLLHNAIMVTPPDAAVEITARPQVDPSGQRFFLFQVKDSGCGISASDINALFSGISPTEELPIAGLSNAAEFFTTRSLVEAQGGRIWIDTIPGKASIFNIVLPMTPDNQPINGTGSLNGNV